MAERDGEQAERIRKEFEDRQRARRAARSGEGAQGGRAAGKPAEAPDVRETVRRKAIERKP